MSKKVICIILSLALACTLFQFTSFADESLQISAKRAVLMDADSGAVLFEKNAHERAGMASTTKIMTALTVLSMKDPQSTVIIPREAVGVEGSSIYLCESERLSVLELLYAIMLASANDAATALALYCSGSTESFAEEMNKYAAGLGLCDTQFKNPHGLDEDGHYTTAYELALIAREALGSELLTDIFSTYKKTISFENDPDGRLLVNHNKLLRSYKGAIGIKTGFTKATGRCLVSAAERDGMTLICVTLGAPDDWRDHTALLDYGFENFERRVISDVGGFKHDMDVVGGGGDTVTLSNSLPLVLTLPKAHGDISVTVTSSHRFLYAPVSRGYEAASVIVSAFGQTVSSPLIATDSVQTAKDSRSFWDKIFNRQ